ncbi:MULTISPECIES: hypothetical protein [unclassified Vibrio]|uniref:hypothetical protein n=1 Tax=unclassified Vibrio TaxID=2614977 RepID=UPI000C866B54|nr:MULTISPECIES: hypothetical protein [unclassified Vibrio]PMK74869.1 hypothetical protein BCT92_23775 [Vibrio sp. 10N.261.52.E5]TKF77996.1 hypothetical protein FCV65_24065 [Vibrio sp. F13]
MNVKTENTYLQDYIKVLPKLLNIGRRFDQELATIIEDGLVQDYMIDYEDISNVVRNNSKLSSENVYRKKVSRFKIELQDINKLEAQSDKKVKLNPALFPKRGYLSEGKAKLVVQFNKGKIYIYNPILSDEPIFYSDGFTALDYISFLNTLDRNKFERDIFALEIIKLFEDGEYQWVRGTNDHLLVNVSQRHHVKNKLNRMVKIGLCKLEKDFYFLEQGLVESYEWLQNFDEVDFKIQIDFTEEGILIKRI